jgi:hypothetical protein
MLIEAEAAAGPAAGAGGEARRTFSAPKLGTEVADLATGAEGTARRALKPKLGPPAGGAGGVAAGAVGVERTENNNPPETILTTTEGVAPAEVPVGGGVDDLLFSQGMILAFICAEVRFSMSAKNSSIKW